MCYIWAAKISNPSPLPQLRRVEKKLSMNAKNFIGGKDNGKCGNEACLCGLRCWLAAEVKAALIIRDNYQVSNYATAAAPQCTKIASAPGQY